MSTLHPPRDCYDVSHKHCPCIEFVVSPEETHGFHSSQLLSYRLQVSSDDPPDKLTLAFSTADVVIIGWRLNPIVQHLHEGDLLAVRPSSSIPERSHSYTSRYANVHTANCLVSSIAVMPIRRE
jgi:hypothetical protein